MLSKLEPYRVLLMKAADVLRERGHCRAVMEDVGGQVCLVGALNVAATGAPWAVSASIALDEAYTAITRYLGMPAPSWNDYYARGADDVIAALESVAFTPAQ